jgi:competence protein ComEA
MCKSFSRNSWIVVAGMVVALLSAAATLPAVAAPAMEPVDVNKAGVEQLMTVPGIGKVMAQRIIDFRKEHGPFGRIEDLLKVKGIGEKSLEKLKPYLKVGKRG